MAELGTYVFMRQDEEGEARILGRRVKALDRLVEIFGGPIELLPPAEALATLRQANQLMLEEPYRRRDAEGNLGGLVELPGQVTPVLIGDLHARLDNLLKILSENAATLLA